MHVAPPRSASRAPRAAAQHNSARVRAPTAMVPGVWNGRGCVCVCGHDGWGAHDAACNCRR
eukprot:4325916-Lingulodinium_polyedra.AAC.1